jgi:hypothetical protein
MPLASREMFCSFILFLYYMRKNLFWNMTQTDRILPLPYLPTYIARFVVLYARRTLIEWIFRRPANSKSDTVQLYNPIFAKNWPKASDNYAAKHRNFYGSSYINIDLDSIQTSPKQYDTYRQSFYSNNDLNLTVCWWYMF